MKITVAMSVSFAVLGCFLAFGCGGEEFVEAAGSGGASDAGDSSAGNDAGLGGAGKDGGGGAAGKDGGVDAAADASSCQPTQDVSSFKLTETVQNSLPSSIKGWSQAACAGAFNYTCPAGYTRTSCEPGTMGSHGGCSDCVMALVECECR